MTPLLRCRAEGKRHDAVALYCMRGLSARRGELVIGKDVQFAGGLLFDRTGTGLPAGT